MRKYNGWGLMGAVGVVVVEERGAWERVLSVDSLWLGVTSTIWVGLASLRKEPGVRWNVLWEIWW